MTRIRVIIGTDGMNKTERAYADVLELRRKAGDLQLWQFEPLKLRLPGQSNFYTPDFLLIMADGSLEFHEVKGFWRDDARVKVKAAAGLYRWAKFVAVQWKARAWKFEEIMPGKSGL